MFSKLIEDKSFIDNPLKKIQTKFCLKQIFNLFVTLIFRNRSSDSLHINFLNVKHKLQQQRYELNQKSILKNGKINMQTKIPTKN
jgi:hypothetical protein